MAAYWVTQNKTFAVESAGSYLWAPLRDRAGAERRSHVILTDMRTGDLVLSYVGRLIIAVGYVLDQPVHAPKPKDLDDAELWQEDGWLVRVHFTELAKPLPIPPLTDRLLAVLPSQHGPLNRDGTDAQGYAYYLPPKAEALLVNALGLGVVERVVEDHMVIAIPDLTTRDTVIEARVGQGLFREQVLQTWGQRCAVTGMAIRELLRASHISKDSASAPITAWLMCTINIGDTCNIIGRPSGSVVADGKPDAAPQRAFFLTSSMSNSPASPLFSPSISA